MNIFFLDDNPYQAAKYYGDKHVGKMLIECCQMMSQALRANGILDMPNIQIGEVYAPTHENHPMTLWVGQSQRNYLWVYEHATALADEWVHRYGKPHGSARLLPNLAVGLTAMPKGKGWRNPPRCIPDVYKLDYDKFVLDPRHDTSCHVASYRWYYAADKTLMHKWTRRDKPEWLVEFENEAAA